MDKETKDLYYDIVTAFNRLESEDNLSDNKIKKKLLDYDRHLLIHACLQLAIKLNKEK